MNPPLPLITLGGSLGRCAGSAASSPGSRCQRGFLGQVTVCFIAVEGLSHCGCLQSPFRPRTATKSLWQRMLFYCTFYSVISWGDKIIPYLINSFSIPLICHPLIIEEPQPVGAFESCSKKKNPNVQASWGKMAREFHPGDMCESWGWCMGLFTLLWAVRKVLSLGC